MVKPLQSDEAQPLIAVGRYREPVASPERCPCHRRRPSAAGSDAAAPAPPRRIRIDSGLGWCSSWRFRSLIKIKLDVSSINVSIYLEGIGCHGASG